MVRNTRGVLPTEYLFQHDFLWDRLIGGHCRCMATQEIALFGQARGIVSFNSAIAARRGAATASAPETWRRQAPRS